MNKALFLDRDGVINIEKNYLYQIEDFEFIDGIFELCSYYMKLGYLILVVTNQSGIARKYYTEDQFHFLTMWMEKQFLLHDVKINHVYFCPHHPSISNDCNCRKPKPGMLFDAKNDFNIDLSNSILIGDRERDIEAGINAGLNELYLLSDDESIISKSTKVVRNLSDIWKT